MKADNPYVGPRTFEEAEKELFFGREREAGDLLSLVMSERLVLFYAQSGAGKSSLINTRLRPQLQQEKFQVLPTARVSGTVPADVGQMANIFASNLVLSLQDRPDAAEVADISLQAFLQSHFPAADEGGQDRSQVLIIDQFEEIFTHHLSRWTDRENFFKQLRQAINNIPLLWVVLSIREDYIAQLDPYANLLPGRLRTRYYMRRLSQERALDAIEKPALQGGRPFEPGVAQRLVDDLRQVRSVQKDKGRTHLGEFVEPVQLQVVCFRLWENLAHKEQPAATITRQDVTDLGNVDTALAQFYEQVLAQTIQASGIPEIIVRDWFETYLITTEGTRGIVYQGPQDTAGLPNAAVKALVDRFLLRAEIRAGGVWYELIHDRFVAPILQSNQAWRQKEPLIQMARTWVEANRHEAHLLEGTALEQALARDWPALGPLVREFLEASKSAQRIKAENQRQREQEQKEAQRQREQERQHALALAGEQRKRAEVEAKAAANARRQAIIAVVLAIFAGVLAVVAVLLSIQANQNRQAAQAAEAKAAANAEAAQAARKTADANTGAELAARKTADANAEAAQLARETADANATFALETLKTNEAYIEDILTPQTGSGSPTSTPTPSPTATPTGRLTSPPGVSPTATSTETPTPTPNRAATATIEALQQQLANIRATQTAISSLNTPTATPNPATPEALTSCNVQQLPDYLRVIWDEHNEDLGCPQGDPISDFSSEQSFEAGYMFWSKILREIVVTIGQDEGSWYRLNDQENEEESCPSPAQEIPAGLLQPKRGFGAIWCAMDQPIETIGWATSKEWGVTSILYQEFKKGLIVRFGLNPDGVQWVYILFNEQEGDYIRESYQVDTGTPAPNPTSTPTSPSECPNPPEDDLYNIWLKYYKGPEPNGDTGLGCPTGDPSRGFSAAQPFQKGYMIWSQEQDMYIVTIGEDTGTWQSLKPRYWLPQPPGEQDNRTDTTSCDPPETIPAGLRQPERGFGRTWCVENLHKKIGWANGEEQGVDNNVFQLFDKGLIIHDGDNRQGGQWIYILFGERRVKYFNESGMPEEKYIEGKYIRIEPP